MRVLLDENLPVALAAELAGHEVQTVTGMGWSGVQNGELLRRMADRFDALVTMDSGMEFQQLVAARPFGVVVLKAASNRLHHLRPLAAGIRAALETLSPGQIRRVGA